MGLWTVDSAPTFNDRKSAFWFQESPIHKRSTPVVGNEDDEQTPTSADVHLYADPRTISSKSDGNCPMLYADCEGFGGGQQDPVATRIGLQDFDPLGASEQLNKKIQPFLEGVDRYTPREITWADCERQSVVESLYPRLFYSFSDVVVFVHENARYALSHFLDLRD